MCGTMRLKIVVRNRTLVSQIGDNGFRSGWVFIYLRHSLSKRANTCTEGSNSSLSASRLLAGLRRLIRLYRHS
jgi:hypothetical protein